MSFWRPFVVSVVTGTIAAVFMVIFFPSAPRWAVFMVVIIVMYIIGAEERILEILEKE